MSRPCRLWPPKRTFFESNIAKWYVKVYYTAQLPRRAGELTGSRREWPAALRFNASSRRACARRSCAPVAIPMLKIAVAARRNDGDGE